MSYVARRVVLVVLLALAGLIGHAPEHALSLDPTHTAHCPASLCPPSGGLLPPDAPILSAPLVTTVELAIAPTQDPPQSLAADSYRPRAPPSRLSA